MARIVLRDLVKTFGRVTAVAGVDLDIRDGEFVVLVGPSGCGKTTTLNMLSGLETPTGGEIVIGDQVVNDLEPGERNLGMVFQDLALFPHLTVFENIAFGLRVKGVPDPEVTARVRDAAAAMRIAPLLDKKPAQCSGGEAQRVALARTIVTRPAVFLMDEPLSSLDAKLRVEMRAEIRQLQQQLKITALYVTHDQEEALAISDRIAVMQSGRIEQVGAPEAIYRTPGTAFVAEFMGTTNLLTGTVAGREGDLARIRVGAQEFFARSADATLGTTITFALRPEMLRIAATPPQGWRAISASVSRVEFLGVLTRLQLRLADGALLQAVSLDVLPEGVASGAPVTLAYDPARVTVFR